MDSDTITRPKAQFDALVKRFKHESNQQVDDALKQDEVVMKIQASIASRHENALKDKYNLIEQNKQLTNHNRHLTTLVSDLQHSLSQRNT